MQNWQVTLLSQYANSPIIVGLLDALNDAIDPAADIDAFVANVWNIDTAQGYGLDVWGRIVGLSRIVQLPAQTVYFGFATGSTPETAQPFGQGVFYGGPSATTAYTMTDAAYRPLILFKAFVNISDMSIPTLNRMINMLLPGVVGNYFVDGYVIDGYVIDGQPGRSHVVDLGGMAMRYVFDAALTPFQQAIATMPGLLPHPTGVTVTVG